MRKAVQPTEPLPLSQAQQGLWSFQRGLRIRVVSPKQGTEGKNHSY